METGLTNSHEPGGQTEDSKNILIFIRGKLSENSSFESRFGWPEVWEYREGRPSGPGVFGHHLELLMYGCKAK